MLEVIAKKEKRITKESALRHWGDHVGAKKGKAPEKKGLMSKKKKKPRGQKLQGERGRPFLNVREASDDGISGEET